MRTPPQVAPIARDSAATGSPHPGHVGEADLDVLEADPATSATPFHWFSPATAMS